MNNIQLRGPGRAPGRGPQLVALAAVWLAACADSTPRTLLSNASNAPPEIQQACALANQRCSHCHPIERVSVGRGIGMHRWQMFVDEMRLKPSSGISLIDADIVLRCLRFIEEPTAPRASPEPGVPVDAPAEPDVDSKQQGRS